MKPISALYIAGSDSGGGAGIQADIKSAEANGVFASTVITAITAQNTQGVQSFEAITPELVEQQMRSVLGDIGIGAIKTGMLPNSKIIKTVSMVLSEYSTIPLVVDPVMISTSGHSLIDDLAIDELVKSIIPLADLVTPNIDETARLAEMPITCVDDMKVAAGKILRLGCKAVLVKGGHLKNRQATDYYLDGSSDQEYSTMRIETVDVHGTGCTYASAITANLASGVEMKDAIGLAKAYLTSTIENRKVVGKGSPVCGHFSQ